MKLRFVFLLPLAAAIAQAPAQASRMTGALPPRLSSAALPDAAPAVQRGTIDAVRDVQPQGVELQIDGMWRLAKRGRTQVLRDGLPVGFDALAAGQAVKFTPASTTVGETALGVVHLP